MLEQTSPADQSVDFLAGFAAEEEFATSLKVSVRTVKRYRKEADGLPSMTIGKRIYIPIEEGKQWIKGRITRPNQRRKA